MTLVPIHILAGSLALLAGGVALYAAKGAKTHRQSGMVFLWAMLAMTLSAVVIGVLHEQRFNTSQGAFTCYLVVTGYLALKERLYAVRSIAIGSMLLALGIAAYDVKLGMEALASSTGSINGIPAPAMFIFGGMALLAAIGDLLAMTRKEFPARYRVGRHLWRMCLALWIATASFFLGQANFIPEPLRILPLLVFPVLLVFGATIYWIVRVSIRKKPWTASTPAQRTGKLPRAA